MEVNISEETVEVFDRHVTKGAGRLSIRAAFFLLMAACAAAIYLIASKLWSVAEWLDSDAGWKSVHELSVGRAFSAVLALLVIMFLIASGAMVTLMSLNGLAWLWRNPRVASSQIILAWNETSSAKRIGFSALMTGAMIILLSTYAAAMLWTYHAVMAGH